MRSYEASLQEKQQQLEKSQQEKVNAITALEQKLDQTLQEILDEEEEKRLLESQAAAIENMQKQQEAAAVVAAAEANKTASAATNQSNAESVAPAPAPAPSPQPTGSRMFIKPAAGVYSSGFGMRGSENHKGLDIASGGTIPIVAAASGTVIHSEYSSSYGNVVYISDNLNGKRTLLFMLICAAVLSNKDKLYSKVSSSVLWVTQECLLVNTCILKFMLEAGTRLNLMR